MAVAQTAWAAFTAPNPEALAALAPTGIEALPFLYAALRRFCQEYPATTNGLSRIEQCLLQAIAAGGGHPVDVFQGVQSREEAPFHGDSVIWSSLAHPNRVPHPLLTSDAPDGRFRTPAECLNRGAFHQQRLSLTEAGESVLAGRVDSGRLNGIDRWLGGVHLTGKTVAWRWDDSQDRLRATADGE